MNSRILILLAFCTTTLLLSACSGGGGDSSKDSDSAGTQGGTPPVTEPPPVTPGGGQGSSQSIALSWNIPEARENGEPLPTSQLGGYEVYFFEENSAQGEGQTIQVTDPNTNEVTTGTLPSGTYHFAIASIDSKGIYSDISEYITATIP